MSLKVKLTALMLALSILPVLCFASIAYGTIGRNATETALQTSSALFDSQMDSYEQKVARLSSTSLDIVSNTSLRILFKYVRDEVLFSDCTSFRRRQILTTYADLQRYIDAHLASSEDLLDGISLVALNRSDSVIHSGMDKAAPGAIQSAMDNPGTPLLFADEEMNLSVCVAFTDLPLSECLGACLLSLRGDSLFRTLMPAELTAGEQLFVLDGDGQVLFHSDAERIGTTLGDSAFVQPAPEAGPASYFAPLEGEKYVVTCQRTVNNPEWTVYYAIPYAYFLASGYSIAGMITPFAFGCALVAFAVAIGCSAYVYSPIRRLTREISRMNEAGIRALEDRNNPREIALLVRSFNALMGRVDTLLKKVAQEAENTKQAEIVALRAQISPHFLYNTLNGIKCMAAQNQTDEIQISVTSLIALLRESLGNTQDVIPLSRELKYVDNYIQLQRYRLDLCFQYRVDVPDALLSAALPHFALQPLVENALIHAFDEISDEGNTIAVTARADGETWRLSVEDNGVGIEAETCRELNRQFADGSFAALKKVGLHNVFERCRHLFGKRARLTIERTGNGTRVTLRLPLVPYQEERTDYRSP